MAEGSGLLNRRTGSTRTVSSNLIPSASFPYKHLKFHLIFSGSNFCPRLYPQLHPGTKQLGEFHDRRY